MVLVMRWAGLARMTMLAALLLVLLGFAGTVVVTCGAAALPGTIGRMAALHGLGLLLVPLVVWIFWVGACHAVIGWALWKRRGGDAGWNLRLRVDGAYPEEAADPSDRCIAMFKLAVWYPLTIAAGLVAFHLLARPACA